MFCEMLLWAWHACYHSRELEKERLVSVSDDNCFHLFQNGIKYYLKNKLKKNIVSILSSCNAAEC
jgi:hypothetical protein